MANNPKKSTAPTKKHLARIERERRQRTYILAVSAVVLFSVFALIIYGIVDQEILKQRKTVALVDGNKISVTEYEGQVRFARYNMIGQAMSLYQIAQMFGSDPNSLSSITEQLEQINGTLFPQAIGRQVLDQMVEDLLIRQEASRLGFSVSPEDVDKDIEIALNYYPEGSPTPSATYTLKPTSTLSSLQKSLIPPTATELPSPTAVLTQTITETIEITPTEEMLTTSAVMDTTPSVDIEPAMTETPAPTSTPFTQEAFEQLYQDTITNFAENYQISEADLRRAVESQIYWNNAFNTITKDVECMEEQVWALHILVEKQDLAEDIKSRLDQGEDWSLMASTYSIDTSNKDKGGDLDWFGKGVMVPEFEQVAFDLQIGETSEPVKTEFGWHIIRILGHEDRPLSESACQQLKTEEFEKWINNLRESAEIEINDLWMDVVPSDPNLPDEIVQFINQNMANIPTTVP